MQFIKHDLGQLSGGEIAEITITNAANVRLLDSENLRRYRYGHRHRYNGGHYTQSPVRFSIPRAGYWYVVVDLGAMLVKSVQTLGFCTTRPSVPKSRDPVSRFSQSGNPLPHLDEIRSALHGSPQLRIKAQLELQLRRPRKSQRICQKGHRRLTKQLPKPRSHWEIVVRIRGKQLPFQTNQPTQSPRLQPIQQLSHRGMRPQAFQSHWHRSPLKLGSVDILILAFS